MIRVALLYGGRSSEHGVSCVTAAGVLGAMDRTKYEVVPIGVTREGALTLQTAAETGAMTLGRTLPEIADNGSRVRLPASTATREFRVVAADGSERSLGNVDIVFPLLHGPWGEDGTIQGMLELVGIPYVGNGVLASALAMDKHMTKSVLAAAGIEVAPWVAVSPAALATNRDLAVRRIRALGLPAFVKPARAGSSVGVTRVTDWDALDAALEVAFAEDRTAIVEQAVPGREIECAVLEGRDGGPTRVSVAGEIVLTDREFYDFDAKYHDAPGVELVCPAELREQELAQLQRIAARSFEAIGGAGLARVDVFLGPEGFVVNEINTMPGFTPISMFPTCWRESGLDYPDLIDELIDLGLAARR